MTVETRTPRRKRGECASWGEGRRGRWKLRDGAQSPDAWGLGMHHSKIETRGTCIPVISHLSPELRPTKREAGWVTGPITRVPAKNMCLCDLPLAGSSRPSGGVILGQAHFRGTRHSVDRMERAQKGAKKSEEGATTSDKCPVTVFALTQTSIGVSILEVLPH